MRFNQNSRFNDEPEINLIPFIDVLLAILIFLVLSTTYNKFAGLKLQLPSASNQIQADPDKAPKRVDVIVTSDGSYAVHNVSTQPRRLVSDIVADLRTAKVDKNSIVVINADASASHQAVINVIGAAKQLGVQKVTFYTSQAKP